jgi:hypothetical protein
MKWDADSKFLMGGVVLGFVLVIPTAYIPGLAEAFYHGPITYEYFLR